MGRGYALRLYAIYEMRLNYGTLGQGGKKHDLLKGNTKGESYEF